ncbi:MAG TPA: RluA family pseudouridine synthase [Burkholderiaceae bacterium]|nr:RluA family pseudouridine synthase [Burkholderiaceae bacterium]
MNTASKSRRPRPARGPEQIRTDRRPPREGFSSAPERGQVAYLQVTAAAAGQRLDNFLLRVAKGVPKSHVYRIVRSGEVRVNKARAKAEQRLEEGDEVRIPPLRVGDSAGREGRGPVVPAVPPVLYEDEHLMAVDKPAGLAAHGGSGVSFGLIEQVRAARPNQAFLELVHRLDRETSGLLLLAKTRRALVGLHEALRGGAVEKHYLALVVGHWHNDRQHVRAGLRKFLTTEGERRVAVDPEGLPSHTVFNLQRRFGAYSLLEAELKTGRTHQIRVHLAHLGFPIIGDDKYGDFALNKRLAKGEVGPRFGRMFLHAASMRFHHPVSSVPLALESPLPPDCQEFLRALDAQPL